MRIGLGPDRPSIDYEHMLPKWTQTEHLLDGAETIRSHGVRYLPRYDETDEQYAQRLEFAKFTNIYGDIVSNLAAKPFSEETTLLDDAGDRYKTLAEDIDGRGNNLHVFAANTFFHGLNYAVDWILVDYTRARPNPSGAPLSLAQEKEQGLRPYWVHIPAIRMLAVYSDVIDGREVITHARMREDTVRRDGFHEIAIQRIRVFDRQAIFAINAEGVLTDQLVGYAPATYEVWEVKATGPRGGGAQWTKVEEGPVTIGVIPLTPFITGRRKGGSWQFVPPLQGVADLQVEHYQQENGLKHARELTAFPMLAGNGVAPPMDAAGKPLKVPVRPRSVLFAPPDGNNGQHGEWTFIEPAATSLKFLAEEISTTESQMRELGRQPLIAQQMTVVQASMNGQKANSAIQAWALALKDALERAWELTALWLNDKANSPEVRVFTDFDLGMDDAADFAALVSMRKSGPSGEADLSRETLWEELRRRGKLSPDFDGDQEKDRLDNELPEPDTEAELQGAMTPPAKTPPQPDPNAPPAA